MCTLAFAWREFGDAWLVVGANRDEATGRPSTPPSVRDGDPRVVMPRDEQAGGTWIGANEHRVFVGVTNRRTDLEGERSRGLLITDALAAETASAAIETVERAVAGTDYAGFNLVLADEDDCVLLEWDGELREHAFDPGTHVVVNEGFDDGTEKSRAVRRALTGHETATEWRNAAREALRDHETGACLHRDGYGTRSSSLLTVEDGDVVYEFADGPPCETEYRRVNDHL
ncbi:NRDE family protein [Halobacterium litoreum]|uniref:NRDE family protein n=1 Tax=Halobacterium litoreum TaxID=2039234 RepID=A0ABD5NAP6_9EURY|nr:NRDE family protein [Halobacterium litoreum]UHH14717.1 NRDE family protein [Halobacterium litoreum]